MSLNLYANQQMMNKDMKKKFTKTFDLSQIAEDPMDSYLDTLGLWKKRIARDGSCLFRAVAEQIYPCQLHHERVRQECVRYMSDHKEEFSKYLTTISYEDYLEAMKNTLEYAGQLEIAAMSKLYNRDFIIYQHPDQPGVDVTQNNYEKKIYLCYSYNNHFDAIFTKAHRDNLALIQSFVYEILYDKVFGSGEQVSVARRLLRKSDTIYPKEYMRGSEDGEYDDEDDSDEREINSSDDIDSERDLESLDYEVCETGQNSILMTTESVTTSEVASTDQLLENADTTDQNNNDTSKGVSKLYKKDDSVFQMSSSSCSLSDKSAIQKMPLPYKVAKSLDPVIYRNTAFDAWQAAKKEYEELVNQKAIAILQTGDKCLVKLNNNYSEKWNLAYVQNIQQDIANVFVVELNESHCVGIENLKPYKTGGGDGQMMHHGNNGFYHNGGSMFHVSSVQNVHKLVQSVNVQFSKIFINTDNKRRNVKKKQQFNSMKKSSSFHAFSTELPPLVEVEEQLAENPFHYHDQHYGYLNNPHSQPMYHLPHHQHQHHSLPPPMAYPHQPQNGPNNHMGNQFAYHNTNGSYTSLPHTQFNDFNDPNGKGKMSNSLSASNLNQYSSMPSNLQGPLNGNNMNSSSSNLNTTNNNTNKNRRQRYPQNNNNNNSSNNSMNFPNNNFSGPFNNNNGMKPQQPWTNNNFQPSPMGPHSNGNFNMHPHGANGPSLLHPQMSNGPQHLTNCNQQPGFNGPLGPQPLGPNQPFMQPPPALAQLHPPNGPMQPPFMHQGPPPPHPHMGPMGPMNPHNASSGHGPRPNFFNPISSFMFGPPPQPNMQSGNQNHMQNMNPTHQSEPHNYYFPSANNNTNSATTGSNHSQNKNNQRVTNQRNDSNNNANKTDSNSKTNNSGGYQQVPQHTSSSQPSGTSLLSMPAPTTTVSTELNQQPLQNTSNYLLMPAPQNNQPTASNANTNSSSSGTSVPSTTSSNTNATTATNGNNTSTTAGSNASTNSNSNMTRSHSYHAGVSQQSYDISNSNSSNVYVDVYHNNNNSQTNNNNGPSGNTSNPNVPNILPGTVNTHSTLLMQANGNSNSNSGAVGNNNGLENINNMYGSNNFHGSYDYQYTRFDNNGFVSSNQTSLVGEDELNNNNSCAERQNNLWNKSNKLAKNQNNFFNDMVYPENNTNLTGQNNSQYYTNCFVVNIDGPINFNATHSLLDDGSDLPISDVNTIRFFYNLGIEYYRLNLATPYTQQAPNYYSSAANTTATQASGQATKSASTNSQNPSMVTASSNNKNQTSQQNSTQSNKLKESNDNQTSTGTSVSSNINSSNSANQQQQVVPQHNANKPLIQHQYNTRRVIH